MYYLFIPIFSLFAVSIALFHQHVLGMEPCAWCILQRFIFISVFLVTFPGIILHNWRKITLLLALPLVSLGTLVAIYQILIASKSNDCAISFAEKFISYFQLNTLIPQVFENYALCSEASATFLTLPYPIWGLISFVLLDIIISLNIVRLFKPMFSRSE